MSRWPPCTSRCRKRWSGAGWGRKKHSAVSTQQSAKHSVCKAHSVLRSVDGSLEVVHETNIVATSGLLTYHDLLGDLLLRCLSRHLASHKPVRLCLKPRCEEDCSIG